MGTYVYYALGEKDGLCSRFLADVGLFVEWLEPRVAEFPEHYPSCQLKKTADIAVRGVSALGTDSYEEANFIDRIVDAYWCFCDATGLHRCKDITPSAHKWYRYAPDLMSVLPKSSPKAAAYYRLLFDGRSIARCAGHAYASADGCFHISWLLPEEVSEFLGELQPFEAELSLNDDESAGVFWMITALKSAAQNGTSLIVTVA